MRIIGWILAVLALLLGGLSYGAGSLVGHIGGSDSTFTTDEHLVASPTRAILMSLGTISFGGHAFIARHARDVTIDLQVRPAPGETTVPFLGYASAADVARYLAPSEFDVVRNVKLTPWSLTLQRVPALGSLPAGGTLPTGVDKLVPGLADLLDERATSPGAAAVANLRPIGPRAALPLPAKQSIWALRPVATSSGSHLQVPLREGSWAVALVSPTGTPGVRAMVATNVHIPLIGDIAHALQVVGGIALLIGIGLVLLLVLPRLLRRKEDPPPGIPGSPPTMPSPGPPTLPTR